MNSKRGETLITLLVFMVVAITVTTSAAMIIMNDSLNATKFQVGQDASYVAESGVEEAILRLLRDPSYTGGTLTVGSGTATIAVTGTTIKTITSVGKVNNHSRKIQVTAGYTGGVVAVTPPWQEVP
ncbi:MAG: hypothetical protein ABIO02_01665 [Patescibacteria group bacterium]